jgi:hypothetical protein
MAKPHFSVRIHEKLHRGDYLRLGHKIFIEYANSSSCIRLYVYFSSNEWRIYSKALTSAKQEAQSRVVDVLLDRSRTVSEGAAEDAA